MEGTLRAEAQAAQGGGGSPAGGALERLDEMVSRDALQEALEGVDPGQVTGPGGLITQLAGRVIEAVLAAELTGHLGHLPGGEPQTGNVRNGSTPKTLRTDVGAVEIRTPRGPGRQL